MLSLNFEDACGETDLDTKETPTFCHLKLAEQMSISTEGMSSFCKLIFLCIPPPWQTAGLGKN